MNQLVTPITVSEINALIKGQIESRFLNILLQGEISNFKHHSSGHMYFTIKDERSELRTVMFRGMNELLNFKPHNGMDVLIRGKITVYEPRGQYQLMASSMKPAGTGTLHLAFEALKKQLSSEGFFDSASKKLLPQFPNKIGIVTSRTGAALKDIIKVFERRAPQVELVLRPALVQGGNAAKDIAAGINDLQSFGGIDLIIIGRGGGSLEDLWPFNEESLARKIFDCDIPIISAVGHETDTTISDMVADFRSPTPSAAAEISTFSIAELKERITQCSNKLYRNIDNKISQLTQLFDFLSERNLAQEPSAIIKRNYREINRLRHSLYLSADRLIDYSKSKLNNFNKSIYALGPNNVLSRGYSIAFKSNGKVIRKNADLRRGEPFLLKTETDQIEAIKKKNQFKLKRD